MTVKCVNLGLPKSGTTTFGRALERAGWKVADHKVRQGQGAAPDMAGTFVGKQIYRGYFATGNPLEYLGIYDALGEISAANGPRNFWPQCDYVVLNALRRTNPDLKFVATWRPATDIADSMMRWGNLGRERLPNAPIPGMPHGFGHEMAEKLRWIDGHYQMLRELFDGDPRFLELRVGEEDAADRLSAHLGVELPWWGRENANPATTAS